MVHVIQPTIIPSPAIVKSRFRIYGEVEVIVKRALSGKLELVYKGPNIIHNDLKGKVRDTLNSNIDFSLDNLQSIQVAKAALSATVNGKDAVYIYDVNQGNVTGNFPHDDIIAMMASAIHPIDPFGSFYRKWQGVYQNLTAGPQDVNEGSIGQSYAFDSANDQPIEVYVTTIYATTTFTEVVLAVNDIMTFSWKITVG